MFNRFEVEVKRAYYNSKRYDINSSFALLYFEGELSVEKLASYLRLSDKFMLLDKNTYFIKFTFTSQEDTFKASQNLLLGLDNYFNNRTCCIAIEELDVNITPTMLLNKLKKILEETRKNSYTRIEDESVLDELF